MKEVGKDYAYLYIESFPELGMCAIISFKLRITKNQREYELSGGMNISLEHPMNTCPVIYIMEKNGKYLLKILK